MGRHLSSTKWKKITPLSFLRRRIGESYYVNFVDKAGNRSYIDMFEELRRSRETGRGSAWLERLVRDQEVGSSNLPAPTIKKGTSLFPFCVLGGWKNLKGMWTVAGSNR